MRSPPLLNPVRYTAAIPLPLPPIIQPPPLIAEFATLLPQHTLETTWSNCWIRNNGRAIFAQQHEPQFAARINQGLSTAGEPWRVDSFDRYPPPDSPFFGYITTVEAIAPGISQVINWYCFRGSDLAYNGRNREHWAIVSALSPDSITYGDCESCPGRWQWEGTGGRSPTLPRMTGR